MLCNALPRIGLSFYVGFTPQDSREMPTYTGIHRPIYIGLHTAFEGNPSLSVPDPQEGALQSIAISSTLSFFKGQAC